MRKVIYAIESSFESESGGFVADMLAGLAFVAALGAGLSWLML